MHPQYTTIGLLDNVHFVIGAIFWLSSLEPRNVVRADGSLLAVRMCIHITASFGELVFEARIQTLVQVIIFWISAESSFALSLVKNFAY